VIKIRPKKPVISNLRKTYTEKEEKRYFNLKTYSLSKPIQVAIIGLVVILSTVGACEAWDGAGNTWSCSNCGTSNYTHEMSCNNCGASQ